MSELSNLDYDSFTFSSMSELSDMSDNDSLLSDSDISDTDISHMDISDTHTNKLIGGMETEEEKAKIAKSKANIQIKIANNNKGDGTESKQQTKLESSITELDKALKALKTTFDKAGTDDKITEDQLRKEIEPHIGKIYEELVSVKRNTKLLEMFNLINEAMIEADKYINDKSTFEEAQTEIETLEEKYEKLKEQLGDLDTLLDKDLPAEKEVEIKQLVDTVKSNIKILETLINENGEELIQSYEILKRKYEELKIHQRKAGFKQLENLFNILEKEVKNIFGQNLDKKLISLEEKKTIEKHIKTVEIEMEVLLISMEDSKKDVKIDQEEEIPDVLMFEKLELLNDILKKSTADSPMIKEKQELLKCLNDYKLELDYRTELVKQDRTNKEQTESDMKKYIEERMKADIEKIYYGVKNKYRRDDGYYKEEGLTDTSILKYTVLLCTNRNYYDTIGLLAIPFINEEDYKKKKSDSLDKYKEYINKTLYKYEHRSQTWGASARTNIVSVYGELPVERDLDIQIITIKDFVDS